MDNHGLQLLIEAARQVVGAILGLLAVLGLLEGD